MIVITDNRSKCTYARTNRRVRWKYAEWCGRWETVDEAIARVKEIFPGQKVEYKIEDRATDDVITGFIDLA